MRNEKKMASASPRAANGYNQLNRSRMKNKAYHVRGENIYQLTHESRKVGLWKAI